MLYPIASGIVCNKYIRSVTDAAESAFEGFSLDSLRSGYDTALGHWNGGTFADYASTAASNFGQSALSSMYNHPVLTVGTLAFAGLIARNQWKKRQAAKSTGRPSASRNSQGTNPQAGSANASSG